MSTPDPVLVGAFQTIVADPPWRYDYPGGPGHTAPWRSTTGAQYPLMALDEIKAIPVPDLATEDAHLYLWAVLPLMEPAFEVVRAWGFRPATVVTWCKPGPGLGRGWRGNTEHLIVARRGMSTPNPKCNGCGKRARGSVKCTCDTPEWRGEPPVRAFESTAAGTWYQAPRGRHSEKPDVFMDLIEQMSPGPYLELFSRRARLGWSTWGNESLHGGAA